MKKPRPLMLHQEKIEEVIEVEIAEAVEAKEVVIKAAEAEDPKLHIKIVLMENVNHNTRKNKKMLKFKKVKKIK